MKNYKKGFAPIILILIVVVVIGGGIYYYTQNKKSDISPGTTVKSAKPTTDISYLENAKFTQYLRNNTVLYTIGRQGQCPECDSQKELFGNQYMSLNLAWCDVLTDVSGLDNGPICKEVIQKKYPIWELKDKTLLRGLHSLQKLAEKTGYIIQ
jgi:hypothetical protein